MPSARAYESEIIPRNGAKYTTKRDFALSSCFGACPCWMPKVRVLNGSGAVIGVIEQTCCPTYLCKYQVEIFKGPEADKAKLHRTIKKCAINCHTCCSVQFCGIVGKELHFEVLDAAGSPAESLKKIHSGCARECVSAADNYEVTLPSDNDEAALLVAAV